MTKPVVSVALLMLYEEGKFQLDDPLEMYLPAFEDVKISIGTDAPGQNDPGGTEAQADDPRRVSPHAGDRRWRGSKAIAD